MKNGRQRGTRWACGSCWRKRMGMVCGMSAVWRVMPCVRGRRSVKMKPRMMV